MFDFLVKIMKSVVDATNTRITKTNTHVWTHKDLAEPFLWEVSQPSRSN